MSHCDSKSIIKRGRDEQQRERQRYKCVSCQRQFDDLSQTIFEGHHQQLRVWVLCLYFMGLNLSNQQIAEEFDLNKDDVQIMMTQLREGVVVKKKPVELTGGIETDEVYIVAGHKGHPDVVKQQRRAGRRRRLKGARGRVLLTGSVDKSERCKIDG